MKNFPNITNPASDICDDKVSPIGKNGLVLCGNYKPKVASRYFIFQRATYDGTLENVVSFGESETPRLLSEMRDAIFGFLWELPDWQRFPPTKPETIVDAMSVAPIDATDGVASTDVTEIATPTKFNTVEFLRVTAGSVPDNTTYKQIVFYMANIGCPRTDMDLLNEAWNPDDLQESFRLYDKARPGPVTHRSVIRYINGHATTDYDLDKIFSQHFEFYDECMQFQVCHGTVWDHKIVAQFCKDAFAYINGAQKFVYRDRYQLYDGHGNTIHQVQTFMRDGTPFIGSDSMNVLIKYDLGQLLKKFGKQKLAKNVSSPKALQRNKDLTKLKETLPDMTEEEQHTALMVFLQPEPNSVPMGCVFKNTFEDGWVKRYANIRFVPYLHENPVHPRTYNSFSSFSLLAYKAKRKVNIRRTQVWKWLWECYAFEKDTIMQWYLHLLAYLIQHPDKRTNRIFVILSEAMGNGKSSFCFLLRGLLDEDKVAYWDDLGKFQDDFDFPTSQKCVNFIDDVSAATPKMCQALNSRATLKSKYFNDKHTKKIKLDVFDSIWITSNDINPLYCPPEDRRQCYLKISDKYNVNSVEFFNKLYEEFEDTEIMKAFFDFFAELDIGNWSPLPKNDPHPRAQDEHKEMNMKVPLRFCAKFFSESEWVDSFRPRDTSDCEWYDAYQIRSLQTSVLGHSKGAVVIKMLTGRFYELYKKYAKAKCPSGRVLQETTFFQQIECLGIKPANRQRFRTKKRNIVNIYVDSVRKGIKKKFPGFRFPYWTVTDDTERNRLIRLMQ